MHQSSIHSEGYRTLDEGWTVEFTIGEDDGERVKAENVTAPGGGPCTGPSSRHRGSRNKKTTDANAEGTSEEEGAEDGNHDEEAAADGEKEKKTRPRGRGRGAPRGRGPNNANKEHKEPVVFWHASLSPEVKMALETKGVRTTTGTIDVSIGSARVKLGTGGYSSVAHADGVLAEGNFTCENDGQVTMVWEKVISFSNGEWMKTTMEDCGLPVTFLLLDDAVGNVKPDENALTLWGDVPLDPRSALESNGFLMRRVVLTPKGGR